MGVIARYRSAPRGERTRERVQLTLEALGVRLARERFVPRDAIVEVVGDEVRVLSDEDERLLERLGRTCVGEGGQAETERPGLPLRYGRAGVRGSKGGRCRRHGQLVAFGAGHDREASESAGQHKQGADGHRTILGEGADRRH